MERLPERTDSIVESVRLEEEEINSICDFYKNEIMQHIVCEWHPEANEFGALLEQQEREKHKANPSYVPKYVAYGICEHHSKSILDKFKKEKHLSFEN